MFKIKNTHLLALLELLVTTTVLILALAWIFEIVHTKWGSLIEFLINPKLITQNESGYISAIGSIAIGFAGAWVAIKIASVATELQKQDSINKVKSNYQKEADRVSGLNSTLTKSILEAKRSCTSFITLLRSTNGVLIPPKKLASINIDDDALTATNELLNEFHYKLEDKLLEVVNAIEALVMDKTYMNIIKSQEKEKNNNNNILESYFKKENTVQDREVIIKSYEDIILKDSSRFDFFKEYSDTQKNFGEGLHDLRSKSLVKNRLEYLRDLVHGLDQGKINSSEAAWLLLGCLLIGHKHHDKDKVTHNTGLFFISLILGSEIDDDLFKSYLIKEGKDNKIIAKIAEEVSKTIFYIQGEDKNKTDIIAAPILQELSCLLKKFKDPHYYSLLVIPGENKSNTSDNNTDQEDKGQDNNQGQEKYSNKASAEGAKNNTKNS